MELNAEQEKEFTKLIKIAILKHLYEKDMLTDKQLNILINKQNS